MSQRELVLHAKRLFPILPITPVRAVRHARRQWVRCAIALQQSPPARAAWRHIIILNGGQ
jgi:hypothetical protein